MPRIPIGTAHTTLGDDAIQTAHVTMEHPVGALLFPEPHRLPQTWTGWCPSRPLAIPAHNALDATADSPCHPKPHKTVAGVEAEVVAEVAAEDAA